jgi:hypothetical protein
MIELGVAPQHLWALEKANLVRLACARKKREIAALSRAEGARHAAMVARLVALAPDVEFGSLRLGELLCSIRRYGPREARRLAGRLGFTETRYECRLRELTGRELGLLAADLERAL